MEKSRGGGDSLASHQALAAHLLACPHPAVCTHLCNTSLGGWRVDGKVVLQQTLLKSFTVLYIHRRSWFHEALSASHTLTDNFMHTDMLDKRVFLNTLSSVIILLSALLRSA